MYHFYTIKSNITPERIVLTGEDVNHIKNVLRMKEGEELVICDGEGTDHFCRIAELNRDSVVCSVQKSGLSQAELPVRLYLLQGLPKKDKMELIIQKAIELGVYEIVPVMTKRVIVKLDDPKKEAHKLERWQAIAEAAAKQSGRGIIPKIHPVVSFEEALEMGKKTDEAMIAYENADNSVSGMEESRKLIHELKNKSSACFFIGPEGGFESSEVARAVEAGFSCISLGKRILRTETAGLAVLSAAMFELD